MGMVLGLVRLRDETIERLIADPPLVWKVIAPDDPEAYERARHEADRPRKPGFFSRLFGAPPPPTEPPRPVRPLELADDEGADVDLDKAWHGIHYVLTGSADAGAAPLDFLLEGGRYVGDEEIGYGPPWAFTSAETKNIADALSAVTDDQIAARYDPRAMAAAGVYPEKLWDRGDTSGEAFRYLTEYLTILRATVAEAVGRGHGLLLSLT
jgi:hypothetical protein